MNQINKKILIVEDEIALLEALRNKLKSEGFGVLTATNGEEGLEIALKEKPDLILLDVMMPIMDGLTMLQELRKKPEGEKVPVIILSNLDDLNKIARALENGSYDYLIKSDWELGEVVKKIKEKLKV